MKRMGLLVLASMLALVALAGSVSRVRAQEEVTTVKLATQNNSGVFGGARLTRTGDGGVRVELTIEGGDPTVAMPAHIHKGTCANLDPNPSYPLTSVLNGTSDTTIAVSLDELAAGQYAINVHKSATEATVYVACGDILVMPVLEPPAGDGGQGGVPGMPSTGSGENQTLLVVLTLVAVGLMATGLQVSRRKR